MVISLYIQTSVGKNGHLLVVPIHGNYLDTLLYLLMCIHGKYVVLTDKWVQIGTSLHYPYMETNKTHYCT